MHQDRIAGGMQRAGDRGLQARQNSSQRKTTLMTDTVRPATLGNHLSTTRSLLWMGALFGGAFYVIDVLIDVYLLQRGNLVEQLAHPGYHEIFMRGSIFFLCVAFAAYAGILLGRSQTAARRAQTAEKFLNSIIDNIPAMIFIKDARELRFVRINTIGEKLLGLSMEQLIGKNDYDFFPKDQADFFTGKDREVLESGTVLSIPEEEIDTRLQGKRVLHTRKVPVHDDTMT